MNKSVYYFREEPLNKFPALSLFRKYVAGTIHVYVLVTDAITDRKSQNGLYLFTCHISGQEFAIAFSDFRVHGGSFGVENSQRFLQFLAVCSSRKLPLIFLINSMGVSFFEGRTVFKEAFALIPALESYKKSAGIYTVALKNVFGLSALLFGLGGYRIAMQQQSLISLAGPQVSRLFFMRKSSFNAVSQVDSSSRRGTLIHEICHGVDHALARIVDINTMISNEEAEVNAGGVRISVIYDRNVYSKSLQAAYQKSANIISSIAGQGVEVFPGFDIRLKVFICNIEGQLAGVLINPIGFADTLLTVNTLDLYLEALAFFKGLQLPLISILDTPGADPAMEQGNYQVVEKMLAVSKAIIDYPYLKIGVIAGRAYGGATILGLPKIFGGKTTLVFRQAELGVMKSEIIETLLGSAEGMLEQWQAVNRKMDADFTDLINAGIIDHVIDEDELKGHIVNVLNEHADVAGWK